MNNYHKYTLNNEDINTPLNKPSTNHQQTTNKRLTTSKNIDNKENDKKEDTPASPRSFSFKDIYDRYPSKTGRKAAERHFAVTVKTEQDWQDINAALANYLKSEKVLKGFIQNASTWFNDWQAWVKPLIPGVKPKIFKSEPVPEREELNDEELKKVHELVQSVTLKCKRVE